MIKADVIPTDWIQKRIYLIRNQKVMIDSDLAELYGIETKILNKAVSRNIDRFPEDFMFQLTIEEWDSLRFHFGTSKAGRGGRRYLPFVFTEQGVAMLSSVLSSKLAVKVNIQIMRAFVKLREILSTHKELAQKLKELELKFESHDEKIIAIFEAINQLIAQPEKPKRKIGFGVEEPKYKYSAKRK
jgi:phage regulator Rha-like protein